MTISKINVVSLPVSDQSRSRDFYVDVLGFDLVDDESFGESMRWVRVAPRGGATSFTLVTWFPTMSPGSLKGIVLETDDVDADAAALVAKGVVLDGEVEDQPWGRFVSFNDPDGNGLILQQSKSPEGAR